MRRIFELSKRELQIAELVAEGKSNLEIAQCSAITEHTVKNYLLRIFDKLGIDNRVKLARYIYERRQRQESPVATT
jgi:DNA-binding CsgD family transcriptional regulator